jgi:predicted transcriptional regulator
MDRADVVCLPTLALERYWAIWVGTQKSAAVRPDWWHDSCQWLVLNQITIQNQNTWCTPQKVNDVRV